MEEHKNILGTNANAIHRQTDRCRTNRYVSLCFAGNTTNDQLSEYQVIFNLFLQFLLFDRLPFLFLSFSELPFCLVDFARTSDVILRLTEQVGTLPGLKGSLIQIKLHTIAMLG